MNLSLADASRLAGVSKSALFKAMKRGVFSGVRDDVTGEWRVNIAELQRVYPLKDPSTLTDEVPQNVHVPTVNESAILSERVRSLEETLDQVKGERDDLRRRLDSESEERRRLVLALTAPQPTADLSAPSQRTPWIWYLIGVCAVIATGLGVYLILHGNP